MSIVLSKPAAACAWCAGATKSVRIDQWKVSTIHEFLQGKLDLSKSKKKAATATSKR
jgi:protein-arginine kinase activator protein McsA